MYRKFSFSNLKANDLRVKSRLHRMILIKWFLKV